MRYMDTCIVAAPDEFTVPAPVATNGPGYVAELNEIKAYQRDLSDEQKEIIKFWSAGAVLRWNEILRELVARHNLPPYQKEDGTYPAPNAANPFAYPQFPFSNPPFAGRAYGYVSAAQYDALSLHGITSNYIIVRLLMQLIRVCRRLIPKANLPSYPSEDAVVAGARLKC